MAVDSRGLAVFQAITVAGSLSRAASQLNMTQPAVTKALRRLEAQLGFKLFERGPGGVTLTPEGRLVLPYTELVNSELHGLEERVLAHRGLGRHTLRLGVLGSIAASILPGGLNALLAAQPGFRVEVLEGIDDALLAALRASEIDLAIAGANESTDEVQVAYQGHYDDTLHVIAARNHPLTASKDLSLKDLLDFPWVLPPDHVPPMIEFRRRFVNAGLRPPEPKVETRSTHVIHALVTSTDFLSWQPRALIPAPSPEAAIVALRLEEIELRREFFVLRRRRGVLAPAAQAFLKVLRAAPIAGASA